MYITMDKYEVLVIILTTFASWEFVVAVNIFQHFKYLSGNGTFSILRAKER